MQKNIMKNNSYQITKAYALYCNNTFVYAYETQEQAKEALSSRIKMKYEAATRIAQKAYDDCPDPVSEYKFDQVLASNEYEIREIEIDDSETSSNIKYRIIRDGEAFMDFTNKDEAVAVFLKLTEDSINEMNDKLKELTQADFSDALSFKIKYNEADALLWEMYQIPRYQIVPVNEQENNSSHLSV